MDLLIEYDRLYKEGDRIIKDHDLCQFKEGRCVNNRFSNNHELQANGCCGTRSDPCEHLGPKGCTAKALGCKLHVCFYLSQIKTFNIPTAELNKLRREAMRLLPDFKIYTRMTRSDLLKTVTKRM